MDSGADVNNARALGANDPQGMTGVLMNGLSPCETCVMPKATPFRFAFYLPYTAALIHAWWGRCVLLARQQEHELVTTGLRDVYGMFGHNRLATGICLILFSVMAIVSIHLHRRHPWWSMCLLLPQQYVMVLSMNRARLCILSSQFADGLPYVAEFISADQIYLAAFALAHTILIGHLYLWEGLRACHHKLSR